MTPEAQRIAIAEACGWKSTRSTGFIMDGWSNFEKHGSEWFPFSGLPDYLNDLNAMHEAEKVLTNEQYTQYEHLMWDIQSEHEGRWRAIPTAAGGSVNMPTVRVRMSSCSAAQRAEAFLRTLGKWE